MVSKGSHVLRAGLKSVHKDKQMVAFLDWLVSLLGIPTVSVVIFRDLAWQSIRLVIRKEVATFLSFYAVLQVATYTFVREEDRF